MKVACIGEAMIELALGSYGPGSAAVGFAGDTLNTAIYLKRCAPDFRVSYVTRLGQDAFSEQMIDFMRGEDLDVSTVSRSVDRHPGLYAISTDDAGERRFVYWRDSSAARQLFSDGETTDFSVLAGFDLLYISAITLGILPASVRDGLLDWLPGYKRTGGKVAFDSNYRPALWTNQAETQDVTARMWQLTDIALPSIDDEMLLFGDADEADAFERLKSYGLTEGALKRGPAGPLSLGEPVKQTYAEAEHVVDTTAAGDSFNGGYLAAYLRGLGQAKALSAGHEMARKVVGAKGAIIPKE